MMPCVRNLSSPIMIHCSDLNLSLNRNERSKAYTLQLIVQMHCKADAHPVTGFTDSNVVLLPPFGLVTAATSEGEM
jgi:hypothetical protein